MNKEREALQKIIAVANFAFDNENNKISKIAQQALKEPTTDSTTLEPNQTEVEKEADKFIKDNMALPSYLPLDSFAPSMRLSYDLAFKSYLEGHSLARKQVIDEMEEWVMNNTESVENQSGDRGGAIWTSELLTYLQTLKK
jgi:hypothetical protein